MNAGTIAAVIAPIALAAGLALAPARQEQKAPPAQPAHDLRVLPVVGQPMLIEITIESKGAVELALPDGPKRITTRQKEVRRLVDEFQEIGEPWKATRRVVSAQKTVDGDCADDETTSTDLSLWSDGEQLHAQLVGGREWARKSLDRLIRQALATGAQLSLPAEARVGDEFDVDLQHFGQLLLALDGETTAAECRLKLEAVDREKQRAQLKGKATLKEALKPDDEDDDENTAKSGGGGDERDFVAEYGLDLAIEVDLQARRIARVTATGTSTMTGRVRGIAVSGRAEVEATLTTAGAEAARKAAAAKPSFRDVVHALPKHGVSLKLPSHFFTIESPVTPEETLYISLLGEDRGVSVAVVAIGLAGTPAAKALPLLEAEILKQSPGATPFKDVRGGLGKGRATARTTENEHHDIEMYPIGADRILRIRVSGTPAAKKAMADELSRFRASIRKFAK